MEDAEPEFTEVKEKGREETARTRGNGRRNWTTHHGVLDV
jgi:hypothetical protein